MVNGDGFSIWLDCCLMIHLFLIDFIWFMVNILPGFCCIKFIVFTVSNNYSRAVIMWDDLFELLGRWLTSASSPKMKMRMRVLSLLMLCLIASTYCQGKLLNALQSSDATFQQLQLMVLMLSMHTFLRTAILASLKIKPVSGFSCVFIIQGRK